MTLFAKAANQNHAEIMVLGTRFAGKRGHSSFLLVFAGLPTDFYGDMALCQEPHELQPEGFATTF